MLVTDSLSDVGTSARTRNQRGDEPANHVTLGIETAFGGNRGGQGPVRVQAPEEVRPALMAADVLVEELEHRWGPGRRELPIDSENGVADFVPLPFAALPAEGRGK